jgi:hypothetical protein
VALSAALAYNKVVKSLDVEVETCSVSSSGAGESAAYGPGLFPLFPAHLLSIPLCASWNIGTGAPNNSRVSFSWGINAAQYCNAFLFERSLPRSATNVKAVMDSFIFT